MFKFKLLQPLVELLAHDQCLQPHKVSLMRIIIIVWLLSHSSNMRIQQHLVEQTLINTCIIKKTLKSKVISFHLVLHHIIYISYIHVIIPVSIITIKSVHFWQFAIEHFTICIMKWIQSLKFIAIIKTTIHAHIFYLLSYIFIYYILFIIIILFA